jgi:RNA polymerase sigma factor (sigma-70 family)
MDETEIVAEYQKFVPYFLHKCIPYINETHYKYSDYISDGNLTLLRAIRSYKENKGKLHPYLICCICRGHKRKHLNWVRDNNVEKSYLASKPCLPFYNDTKIKDDNLDIQHMMTTFDKVLSKKEQTVVKLRNWENKSFNQIGVALNTNRESARQIYNKSIKKLKLAVKAEQ